MCSLNRNHFLPFLHSNSYIAQKSYKKWILVKGGYPSVCRLHEELLLSQASKQPQKGHSNCSNSLVKQGKITSSLSQSFGGLWQEDHEFEATLRSRVSEVLSWTAKARACRCFLRSYWKMHYWESRMKFLLGLFPEFACAADREGTHLTVVNLNVGVSHR